MKKSSTRRVILTGGGTAGHVTPNLAIVPLLRRQGFDIRYIGTSRGMERELIIKENIPYYAVPAGKLRRYADVRNITDIMRIKLGFLKSIFLIATIGPDVVFSKGGFVACPVVWAAWIMRVPVIVHESDISPGLANRLSFPFASQICYSFPETASHLPRFKSRRDRHTGPGGAPCGRSGGGESPVWFHRCQASPHGDRRQPGSAGHKCLCA